MKKTVFTIAFLAIATGTWAQKSKIRSSKEYLSDNNYTKAITVIDEAVANDDTKNNADAWYYRGIAYQMKSEDTTVKSPDAAEIASASFIKALELKPDYGEEINNPLHRNAITLYNEGVVLYSNKEYKNAYAKFMKVNDIYNVSGGKRYGNDVKFKELAISAKNNAAYCSLKDNNDDQALMLFKEIKNQQTPKDTNVYYAILEILERQKKTDELLALNTEAMGQFPNNKQFKNIELNYYLNNQKMDVLIPKLEAAVQGDPNNPELLFNLGNGYEKISFPKDASGKLLPRPANAEELFGKAEDAYKRALALKPESPDYNYNFGVLYYDVAVEYNRQMNDIKGMSAAETKKYDDLQVKRDAQFAKALPYFEKTYAILDVQGANMSEADKPTYTNSLRGLLEIYSRQNNKEKVDVLRKKLNDLK